MNSIFPSLPFRKAKEAKESGFGKWSCPVGQSCERLSVNSGRFISFIGRLMPDC